MLIHYVTAYLIVFIGLLIRKRSIIYEQYYNQLYMWGEILELIISMVFYPIGRLIPVLFTNFRQTSQLQLCDKPMLYHNVVIVHKFRKKTKCCELQHNLVNMVLFTYMYPQPQHTQQGENNMGNEFSWKQPSNTVLMDCLHHCCHIGTMAITRLWQ